jgi:mRNA-degrading endonuclease RelE of RelBE toxin-antitoxin system
LATVRPTTRAKEQIANLPFDVRETLDLRFADLAADPRSAGYELQGTRAGEWCMPVLEYRVGYLIQGRNDQDVIVFSVLHRGSAYPRTRH